MKYLYYFLLSLLLLPTFSAAQWEKIENIDEFKVFTFSFVNDDVGYVLLVNDGYTEYALRKTVNGGSTWLELNLPAGRVEYQDVYFIEEGVGYIVSRNLQIPEVPTKLSMTTDDGASWVDISPSATPNGNVVGQCLFLDINHGYLITGNTLFKTIDGGETWASTVFDQRLLSLDFLDEDHGLIGTWDGTFGYRGGMLSTSDGGASWSNVQLDLNYSSISRVFQLTEEVAIASPINNWAATIAEYYYKTTDGGKTWEQLGVPLPLNEQRLKQIYFEDENNGILCFGDFTNTAVFKTTDGGMTWSDENLNAPIFILDMQMTANTGYMSGDVGSFYKRTGVSHTHPDPSPDQLSFYPSPIAVGQDVSWKSDISFDRITFIDAGGKRVYEVETRERQIKIPPLPAGIYTLWLSNAEGAVSTGKIVVE